MNEPLDPVVVFLRHTVATIAYRAGKTLRGAPEGFGEFRAADGTRSPGEILTHMGDLFGWALALADGKHVLQPAKPLEWDREVERFFTRLKAFDQRLASGTRLGYSAEKLFQGPIADALTHTGQIAMLRRMAGAPVRGENYFRAEIEKGSVGAEQAPARVEFD